VTGIGPTSHLARRLAFWIILFSGCLTLMGTGAQVVLDWRHDRGLVHSRVEQVGGSHLPALSSAVWAADDEQIEAELEGILGLPDLEQVRLQLEDEPARVAGEVRSKRTVQASFPIRYEYRGQEVELGEVEVVAGLDRVVRHLRSRVLLILATQAAKTFVVAFFILFLVHRLLTRHVVRIARYGQELDPDTREAALELGRRRRRGDELDALVGAVNQMTTRLRLALEEVREDRGALATELERRTAEIRQLEHHRVEARLQRSQKLESLGLLAGGIAHDFNNLLVGILGNASLALAEMSEVAPGRVSVAQIELTAQRAAELVRQLLAYSGKGRFVVEPLDLSDAVGEMASLLEVTTSKKAALKLDLTPDLPAVMADVAQVRQLVMNFITNASDAIGDEVGTITVATYLVDADREYLSGSDVLGAAEPGRLVAIEVSDTGSGMDAETRARIFDPFFSTKESGHGLGLAAALGIVRGHRGAIRVYSEPGRGTSIKVLLPACDARPERTARALEAAAGADPVRGGVVLVADDEEVVRELVRRTLERAGFEVLLASDGVEAVETFRAEMARIDLVLLDMAMPRLGGDEVQREVQRLRPGTRVILSSGYNEQDATSRCVGRAYAGFLQKPYTSAQLVEVVSGLLADEDV
jgi:signal transduction histidine kinase/ActR/RegA family two-component response regulator